MSALTEILSSASNVLWNYILLVLLPITGLFLMAGLKAIPWRHLGEGFQLLWKGRASREEGDITPFQALMTALAATIGTGNIAGVATAIYYGGPGAVFWMWLIALIGMATKYSEAVLAVRFREVDEKGKHVGGPMYYIKNGLSKQWHWLGTAFAIFGMFAAFGIGNMVQSNSVAHAMESSFGMENWLTGAIITIVTASVILGGINRIATVAAKLVPFMAIAYITGAMIIILMNITGVPAALATIVNDAFTGTAATGGFLGATIWAAIRFGVARGIFSNEAGLGSAPIAHAAARTNDPIHQGMIGMLGTFIDTIIICTMTALVIILTGVWTSGENGAALSTLAFNTALPGVGSYIVSLGLVIFAFTTVLGWSYYGERCAEFLFGIKIILPYRLLWLVAIMLGALGKLEFIWLLADVLNGLMAIPNLIALLALSPVVFQLTRDHFQKTSAEPKA